MKKRKRYRLRKGPRRVLKSMLVVGMMVCAVIILKNVSEKDVIDKKYNNLFEAAALTEQPTSEPTESTEDLTADGNVQQQTLDFESLPENCAAWLKIESLNMSFPVMQGSDNDFYLTHDCNGIEDPNGSIFLDCNTNLEDPYSIIYGHNMTKSGAMFNDLYQLKVGDMMEIITEEDLTNWQCVAKYESTVEDSAFLIGWSEDSIQMLVDAACEASGSSLVELSEGQHVLSLVTCDRAYAGKAGRLICMFVSQN